MPAVRGLMKRASPISLLDRPSASRPRISISRAVSPNRSAAIRSGRAASAWRAGGVVASVAIALRRGDRRFDRERPPGRVDGVVRLADGGPQPGDDPFVGYPLGQPETGAGDLVHRLDRGEEADRPLRLPDPRRQDGEPGQRVRGALRQRECPEDRQALAEQLRGARRLSPFGGDQTAQLEGVGGRRRPAGRAARSGPRPGSARPRPDRPGRRRRPRGGSGR